MLFKTLNANWEIDENGFMRNRIRVLAAGVMNYAAHELGAYKPDGVDDDTLIPIYVPITSINNEDTIRSLEGMPVVTDVHNWIKANDDSRKQYEAGSIAGTPVVNGKYLEVDIVIRDSEAIAKVQSKALVDISAGYASIYDMSKGLYDNTEYEGQQREIRFNHVAILPPNQGRGGHEIRVLNNKEVVTMEFTEIELPGGQMIRVANADAGVAKSFVKTKVQNEGMSASQMEDMLTELETLKGREGELMGQLSEMKERMESVMSPESMEEAVNEMAEERDDAASMMMQNNVYEEKDKEKAMNSLKGLRGHDLRVHVVNSIRVANKRSELSAEEASNEGIVSGMLKVMSESPVVSSKKSVAGRQVVENAASKVKTQNKKSDAFGYANHAKYVGE